MANRFTDSFNQQPNYQQSGPSNIFQQFNAFRQNPYDALSRNGIQIPEEYRGSYQQAAQYLMQNMPQAQQSGIFQRVNMLKQMLGFK